MEIWEISNYYKGELNGPYNSYYLNGSSKINAFLYSRKVDSTFEAFYLNGNLAEKGKYAISPKIATKDTSTLDYWMYKSEEIISFKKVLGNTIMKMVL